MHKQFYGRCRFKIRLTAKSELLVQGEQREATGSATFLRARDPATNQETYCIPASSFKGVLRSASEKILRSFAPWLACDPFEKEPTSPGLACSHRWTDQDVSPAKVYALICPACRLFGCTLHAGMVTSEDAWLDGQQRPIEKTGIAIDGITGSVRQGPFTFQMLPRDIAFRPFSLAVDNFALWQIGLLALVFRDVKAGQVRLGWGTRKGLGQVDLQISEVTFRYPRRFYGDTARGLGNAQPPQPGDSGDLWLLPDLQPQSGNGWREEAWIDFALDDEALIQRFLAGCVEEALAPKLMRGCEGFAYVPSGEEVPRA